MAAAKMGRTNTRELLLDRGFDAETKNYGRMTAPTMTRKQTGRLGANRQTALRY